MIYDSRSSKTLKEKQEKTTFLTLYRQLGTRRNLTQMSRNDGVYDQA
jgi:hypothetical protein